MRKVCIRVDRRYGEQVRLILIERELLDADFPISQQNDLLLLPLRRPLKNSEHKELKLITPFEIAEKELEPIKQKPRNLAQVLQEQIPEPYLKTLPHSLDIIGEIAVVELTEELAPYSEAIGTAIMTVNPRVKTVYAKAGGVTGPYRLRPLNLIAGKSRTQTEHREYGIRIVVDVTHTYFSPRLGTEHDRVAKLVQSDETVLDMFTGVGPFALLIAHRHPSRVYAIDLNERAIHCLEQSLKINQLKGEIIPLLGDSREIVQKQLVEQIDRVIMNLPHDAMSFLDVAALALKTRGGIIHFYGITTEGESLDDLSAQVIKELAAHQRDATIKDTRVVRPSAPHEVQIALDIEVAGTRTSRVT